jgi:cytochrome c peroxidase
MGRYVGLVSVLAGVLAAATMSVTAGARDPNLQYHTNPTGISQTFSTLGVLDPNNAFFQNLGSNGRSCSSCHRADQGWSVVPELIRARFDATDGEDPIFRTNDGAVCPTADVSTIEARREAFKLLLTKGLIRVSLPIPTGAEFELVAIDDPHRCSSAADLALFRRPLPATNLAFLSAVMWDGRESSAGRSLHDSLLAQANGATRGHAQAFVDLSQPQLESIVKFEMALFTAQVADSAAGLLTAQGAKGGATPLSRQEFYIGINDPLGLNPTGAAFDPKAFQLFTNWSELRSAPQDRTTAARGAIARGESLFNNLPISIQGVSGLNDELGLVTIPGTCTTCHDSPNVGNHSVAAPLNLGLADEANRTPDLPLYTLRCITTGEEYRVTDPGRALITGKCKDIGRFKGPILRGLAARAPYFHNGAAATLRDVVEFYDRRFNLGLSTQDKEDLAAFLRSL